MAAHDYHDALPGYAPEQILFDGCGECKYRATTDSHGIGWLDQHNFARAWARAAAWNQGRLGQPVSTVEAPMLVALWAVQLQLEHFGWPVGTLPVVLPVERAPQ